MKVLALSREAGASISQIRLARPLGLLASTGALDLRLRSFHQLRRCDAHWADVVILQRATGAQQLGWMQQWQARGLPVVYEIDDLLTEPAVHLAHAGALLQAQPALRAMLARADLITVTTEPLAAALSQHGPPVRLVPNGSADFTGTPARHDDQRPISLIVASSDAQQLQALGDALALLLAPSPAAAARHPPIELWGVGPVTSALRARGLPHKALPLLPLDGFLPALAALPNPVGLIPLDDSAFSRCKSAVKFFDYAMAGIPSLCADLPPYAGVVQDRQTGWRCTNQVESWLHALQEACSSAELRTAVARAARQEAQARHGLAQMTGAWRQALAEAVTLRHRLPASLARRGADALLDAVQAPLRQLREANRQRLRQRQ